MVASENTEPLARSAHGFGNRGDIPDKALQLASHRSRARRDYCKTGVNYAAKARCWTHNVCRAHPLCGNAHWRLGGEDEISHPGPARSASEEQPSRLGPDTGRRLVAASSFYPAEA